MFAARTDWSLTPNRLSRLLEEFRSKGRAYLDLTESNPTHCFSPTAADTILKSLADPRALRYEPDPRGWLAAREAVVRYYAERGVDLSPRQIFLTTSTSEGYTYIFRLVADAGDSILVPRPSYPLFDFLAGLNDLKLIPYPLTYHDGWAIDLAAVESSLKLSSGRVQGIVVVHPNNPTGSFVSPTERDTLAGFCADRGLALIADEVFSDYAWAVNPERAVTHAGGKRVLTFTLSGLSKISALPHMKLAWVVVNGPEQLLASAIERLEVIADTYLSVSAPLAHALPTLLDLRHEAQRQILDRVKGNLNYLDQQLAPQIPVGRLRGEGGWYAILRVPTTRTDEDWAVELLAHEQVLVHPGHFYDFLSDGHLVVSLLTTPDVFQEGISRLLTHITRGS